MDFTKFLKEMDIIALLDDAPNDVGGLTANELKAKFDEGGKAIRDFINNVLLVELKNYTEEAPSPEDIEKLYDAIHEVVLGQIPDGTITEQKIADGAVSVEKLKPGTLDGAMPKVSMNAPTAADNIDAGFPIGKTWLRPNYTLTNLAYNKSAEEFVATACAVSKAGQTFTIAGNGDDKAISADLNHGSANGWLYCVVTPDATAASASLIVGGETVALTVGEANTIQRRYTGESIKFEATYETANAAAAGTITVENLTIIDEAATLEQVDESCRDVSDNTVFGFVLGNLPFDKVEVAAVNWRHVKDGIWDGMATTDRDLKNLAIVRIKSSQNWVAPKAAGQKFEIFAVGGGGGGFNGSYSGGGGGGYIETVTVEIPLGEVVEVVCGAGGAVGTNGGLTSFGSYVSAEGGKGAIDGNGADGGAGGGGGGSSSRGGNGGTYGGGGGGGWAYGAGGNGGIYGGGGGGGGGSNSATGGPGGTGGTYGGDGGRGNKNAAGYAGSPGNAFMQFAYTSLSPLRMSGYVPVGGNAGSGGNAIDGGGGGGGGYGGNGGAGANNYGGGGGGGGYGGNGGNSGGSSGGASGGGGGNYGGNGGNGGSSSTGGGGGGGFFCNGANGGSTGGGGGGFFDNGKGAIGGNGGVLIAYYKEG